MLEFGLHSLSSESILGLLPAIFKKVVMSYKCTGLDWYQYFVSTDPLESQWMELHPILYNAFISARSRSGLLPVIFSNGGSALSLTCELRAAG